MRRATSRAAAIMSCDALEPAVRTGMSPSFVSTGAGCRRTATQSQHSNAGEALCIEADLRVAPYRCVGIDGNRGQRLFRILRIERQFGYLANANAVEGYGRASAQSANRSLEHDTIGSCVRRFRRHDGTSRRSRTRRK